MKRISLLLAPALLLAACATEVTDLPSPEGSGAPIAFQAPQTRAAVEGTADMNSFSVWGWYTPGTDANPLTPVPVFNAKKVTRSGDSWTYQGLQYWIGGKTYDFYAVHPAIETLKADGCTASYDSNGTLNINAFDATKGHDLMTAQQESMDGSNPQTVGFTFQHLLARVNIQVQAEGGTATIASASLNGIPVEGSYDSGNTANPWTLTTTTHTFTTSNQSATSIPSSLFGDLLLPPQVVSNFNLSVTYSFTGGADETKTISLPTDVISQWEAGQNYTYTLILTSNYISFTVPEVNEWGEASGGIIIVD